MGLDDLLRGVKTIAIVCNQWGDSGKGKFSHYFSQWAEVIARGTGGNNAGHTVVVNREEKILHLIPAGILYDSLGKFTILGNGTVIEISALSQEIAELNAEGIACNNLMVSKDANVVMPYHVNRDKSRDQSLEKGGIGSTGRGIGPCYDDKVARRGVLIEDLFDRDKLARKIKEVKERYPEQTINTDEVIETLMPSAEKIRPFVRDTVSEVHRFRKEGKKILLEGAQGLLLSIEHGTYPYVTSSDCSLNGTASGVGLSARMVDLPLGIVKFPFMTRVGGGPFPTELGGRKSEDYCAEKGHTKVDELTQYEIPHQVIDGKVLYDKADPKILKMMNSEDEFIGGIGIRLAAGEYGATTGRPRRIGWTDAVSARYAVEINGPFMILTKPDSISGIEQFKICYGYKEEDKTTETFSRNEGFLRKVSPDLQLYDGYKDIKGIRNFSRLPTSIKQSIKDFEAFTVGRAVIVSTGDDREDTIVR